ncbi:hypothetical protein ACSQ67_007351 [Phaseolus vulgaris]|uniref:Uncharacterized protein n=1 Tax=Phaseolus vulgaris TaxID=3885 RepID=V7CE63_PHAVU|nr:hypothetical protein PHAVU_003G219700g [Phaseolus vulgaris]ESW27643.1 hypothetical protein PHAVU_003G219700g [Phaseolus vulgaris]
MTIIGCDSNGSMDDTKFSKPMPWIGIYIAAASLACLVAMAADLIHGIRGRKFWFPCKFFCLNATSLAIIAVAVKLSVDLNTPMPHRQDQLSKLSSSAMICTIMANSMPTLGITENKDTMMNLVAMAILVVTMIVNICIQFVTGVIYMFWVEHAVIMLLMVILLMTMTSSAVSIPKIKHYFELKLKMNKEALKECSKVFAVDERNQIVNELRDQLMKIWMMTHTSSPQFVLGRSVSCTASGAFCLLSTMALVEALLRSYLMPWSFDFCSGDCDYKWSTILILIVQVAAVVVGTIAPAFRWFIAISYKCPNVRNMTCKRRLHVEGYWTTKLISIKESPLGFRIHNRQNRKLAHDAKTLVLSFCIKLQVGIVLMSKATQYVSISFMCLILTCCDHCKKLQSKFMSTVSSVSSGTGSKSAPKLDLRRFVLYLEGEEELVEVMLKQNRDATIHWVKVGEKKEPKLLIELLEKKCSLLQGFKGVRTFDSEQVRSLHCGEAAYSWSLPLVTLGSIAVALPHISRDSVKKLISTVNEALPFVKFIENNLDKERELYKLRSAAEIVWLGVDLYNKWLDVDLRELSLQDKSPKETLEQLADAAKTRYEKFKGKYRHVCIKTSPSLWPNKVSASHTMYRICKTALLNQELLRDNRSERLFEALTAMISDIVGACLTNLPFVISDKCLNSTIEEREDTVRNAVYIFGKTKKIIEMIEKRAFPRVNFCRGTYIEDWRLMHKQNSFFHTVPSSPEIDTPTDSSTSSDVCLNID